MNQQRADGGATGPPLGDMGVARVGEFAVVGQAPLVYQERVGPAALALAFLTTTAATGHASHPAQPIRSRSPTTRSSRCSAR